MTAWATSPRSRSTAGATTALFSVGDIKSADKLIKKVVHGNSKASTRAQHAYDIINKSINEKVKVVVSGGKVRRDGKSYRAERQVRKWNREEGGDIYESTITHEEPAGEGARDKILKYEEKRADTFSEELKRNGKHKRP